MLTLPYLREHTDEAVKGLAKRNIDVAEIVRQLLSLDDERKKTQQENDSILAQLNETSKQIGALYQEGKKEDAEHLKNEVASKKELTKHIGERLASVEKELKAILLKLPNVPHNDVPAGTHPGDNQMVRQHGNIPPSSKGAMAHWELARKYNIIDFELGAKITGSGFPLYRGNGARLQRALINFFLDKAIEAGYVEVQPPILINEESGYGTGQLPDKDAQMYHITSDNLYLAPTAEVPLTNMFRDTILKTTELPVKITAYTPCFRREAGSYGKDVKGLNRVHQFDKVEIVQITHPALSYKTLDEMVEYVSGLLAALELPYRVMRLCGGDLGFASAMTYDMEVYSAAQEKWLEVSSVSNFETFQANRLKLRFKDEKGKTALLHTLNGSALALPRIVAALMENNQTGDGIVMPEAIRGYCGFSVIN